MVKLHAPFEPAVALPILVVPSNMATVLPASAVPVRTSTCVLARVAAGVDAIIVGADGAAVSMATDSVVEAPLVPADVVAVVVKEWVPSVSVPVVKLQLPLNLLWRSPPASCRRTP